MKRFSFKFRPFLLLFKLILFVLIFFSLAVLALRFIDIETSAFMMQQNKLAEAQPKKYLFARQQWVDIEQISPNLILAAIASEDQKFLEHYGFDFQQIINVIINHKKGKKLRGASTITQQTIKNLFLWGSGKKTYRKIIEAMIVPFVELIWSKKRIMEVYLNIVQFDDVTYGAKFASKEIFGKSAKKLTMAEAAWLIAVLPSPSAYNIKKPTAYLKDRQKWVLSRMHKIKNFRQNQSFLTTCCASFTNTIQN